MNPRKQDIDKFLEENPHKITPGVQDCVLSRFMYHADASDHQTMQIVSFAGIPVLIELLRAQGKEVFLVSGGFRQIIHPLAESLGIPLKNVFANSILFKVRSSAAHDQKWEIWFKVRSFAEH